MRGFIGASRSGLRARAWAWLTAMAVVAMPAVEAAAQTRAEPLAVTQIAPGVFAHSGRIGVGQPDNAGDIANLGFVIGSRCVAVIDTGSTPGVGQRLRAAVERETALPICYVINTHAHPDHIFGNAAFRSAPAEFVGSSKFNAALSAREPFFRNALQRDLDTLLGHDDVVYPSVRIQDTMDLDLGGRRLTLQAWPTAHTDNDLTVFDNTSRTLFTGDLLFIGHIPVIDGKLVGWLAVMTSMARIDAAIVVPGHGPVGRDWPGAMAAQRDYLEALRRDTRAALKAHITLGRAVETIGLDAARPWQLAEQYHRRNVTAAYAELEWE